MSSFELRPSSMLVSETLRMSAAATHHARPRFSPGGKVDGDYIPRGVSVLAPFSKPACLIILLPRRIIDGPRPILIHSAILHRFS